MWVLAAAGAFGSFDNDAVLADRRRGPSKGWSLRPRSCLYTLGDGSGAYTTIAVNSTEDSSVSSSSSGSQMLWLQHRTVSDIKGQQEVATAR